jgi:hypothetical protein
MFESGASLESRQVLTEEPGNENSHAPFESHCLEDREHESQGERQTNLRSLQGCSPSRQGLRNLREPSAQATPGLVRQRKS